MDTIVGTISVKHFQEKSS